MTAVFDVAVDEIKIFRMGDLVKGIARVGIRDWGIQIDNLTWKLERGGVKVKFPVIKRPGKTSPLFLLRFDEKEQEKALKKQIAQQIKAYLSEKIEPQK